MIMDRLSDNKYPPSTNKKSITKLKNAEGCYLGFKMSPEGPSAHAMPMCVTLEAATVNENLHSPGGTAKMWMGVPA